MAIENIDVALQINEAIARQQKLLARSTKELKDQLAIMRGIQAAHEGEPWDDQISKIKEIKKALEDVEERATDTKDQFKQTQKALEQMSSRGSKSLKTLGGTFKKDLLEQFPMLVGGVTGFIGGATKGFSMLTNIVTGTVGAVSSLGLGIFDLAKSIIAIPFKILGGLVDMANNLPSDTAFGEAREAIRKEFGDFGEDLAQTTKKMYKSLRGELAETNLSVFRVFGNMAERLAAMHEVVKGMGNVASLFREELRGAVDKGSTERILAFQKGLGVSGEQMKQIGLTAKISGKRMTDVLLEITKASTGFADAFNLSQKVIARDIATMNADVANFGSLTVHEMGRAAVYMHKLGMEIKDVIGTIEKYDNFEDAAVGAAHLAQAFGANVDALDMMREQDPTKRLDMLRKSMASAGVDAEKLTRQELKLLAQQTGLTEEAAKMAFSLRNQGVSMNDLEKQQKRNEKSTMTQEEAMVRLSDSIERLVKSGSSSGGFFTQFFQGFERGVKRMSPFRTVLRFIRRDLRIIKWLGVQTGAAFVKFFPGVKEVIQGMLEFFNPKRFKQLRSDLGGVFNDMFKDNITFEKGLGRIKDIFVKFFTGAGGGTAFKKIRDGAMKMGLFVMKWVGEGVKMSLKFLTKAMNFVTDFIMNPTAAIARVKSAASSSKNPIVKLLRPLWDALKDRWPDLRDAFLRLWSVAWPKITAGIKKLAGPAVKLMFLSIFGPAAIQGVLGAAIGSVVKGVGKQIGRIFTMGAEEATKLASRAVNASGSIDRLATRVGTKFISKASAVLRVAGPIGIAVGAALGVSEGLDMFLHKIDPKFDKTTRKLAAAATGMIHGFTLGLLPEDLEVKIANGIAQIQTWMFDAMGNAFGKSFVANLKDYLDPLLDLWGGLGDTIVALVTGDEKKFDAAFDKVIDGIQRTFIHGLKFMIIELVPGLVKFGIKAIGMVGRGLTKAVSMIWDKLGDIVSGVATAIFGEGIGKAVKWVFSTVKNIYDSLSTFVFKTLPTLFAGAIRVFTQFGNNVWDTMTGKFSWEKWKNWFSKLGTKIVEPFKDLGSDLGRIWTGWTDEFKRIWNDLSDWFTDKVGFIKGTFDTVGSYIRGDASISDDASAWGSTIVAGFTSGASRLLERSSDNLGAEMVSTLSSQAQEQTKREMPALTASIGRMLEPLSNVFNDPVGMMDKLKKKMSDARFKDEALKMGTTGVSFEDMSLYEKVKEIDPVEVEKNIRKFRDNVVPLFIGKYADDPDSLLGQVRKMSEALTETDVTSIGEIAILTNFGNELGGLATSLERIGSLKVNPVSVVVGMGNMNMALTGMMSGVNSLAASIDDDAVIDVKLSQERIKSVAQVIEDVVQQVNDVNTELSDVSARADVKLKLKNLAKSLGVKNEKFEVKNDKVKIQIQLDVKLEAEQIAYAVKKGNWFSLTPGSAGFPKQK